MNTSQIQHTDNRSSSRLTGAIGGFAAILTVVGLSGVGDAPAPLEEARLIADHFQAVRTDVFIGAAIGMIGIAAMVGFVAAFALRLVRAGEHAAGIAVGAGLTTVVAYLLALHTVYLSLSYGIAAESAGVTKGLFVATILAVPVFGLGVATLLFAAALGSRRANLMPKLWQLATLGAGTLCTISVFSYADSGFFSPDVQQQLVAHVLLIWLTTTSVVGAIAERGVRQRDLAREVDVYRAWRSSRIA